MGAIVLDTYFVGYGNRNPAGHAADAEADGCFLHKFNKIEFICGYLESSPLMPPLTFSTLSPSASAVACTLKKKTDGIMFLSV